MTQRSIQAGQTATVIVRAGGTVRVEGREGDRVLANTEGRWGLKVERRGDAIEVHIGGSGTVYVSLDSSVKVYAGKDIEVRNIGGSATIYAGGKGSLRAIHSLVHASAGAALDIECERIEGDALQCSAGRDLRFYIRALRDARLMINDLGGYWEGVIGAGRTRIRLTAGGDVALVTDQTVVAQPPHYILGKIERPGEG
ncbi:MAG: hypothetical protein ACJ8CR_17380 [Roseiflexaceae bacterium]